MHSHMKFSRLREIGRVRGELVRDSYPRMQMFLMVALTGGSGFVASNLMLRAGLTSMGLRYLAAFAVAYLVFLGLLWVWLRTRGEDLDLSFDPGPDLSSSGKPADAGGGKAGAPSEPYSGKGGTFDGGGASGNYETAVVPASSSADLDADSITFIPGAGNATEEAIGEAAGADEFAIPFAVLVIAAAILFSTFFIIQSAPVLFAELLVDGALSATLFRRLRGIQSRHWIDTALRRTAMPFALTAAIVSACGWGMTLYAPDAHSVGDVMLEMKRST